MQLKWTTLEKHNRYIMHQCTMLSFGINHLHPFFTNSVGEILKNMMFFFVWKRLLFFLRLEKNGHFSGHIEFLAEKNMRKFSRLSDNAWQAWQVQSGRWLAWCHRNLKVRKQFREETPVVQQFPNKIKAAKITITQTQVCWWNVNWSCRWYVLKLQFIYWKKCCTFSWTY